jgi:hypothetical protein
MALVRPIQRARAAWSSAPVAVLLLIGANLIPLVGVLFFGWQLFTILVLYWLENGVVGLFNVARIARASGPEQPGRGSTHSRAYLAPFFLVHYGIFWVVHGVFVFMLAMLATGEGVAGLGGVSPSAVALGGLALVLSHGTSFFANYLGRGEHRLISPSRQFAQPYPRMIVLHVTILLGAFVLIELGEPVLLLAIMVALKTALDLLLHLIEHGRLQRAAPPA